MKSHSSTLSLHQGYQHSRSLLKNRSQQQHVRSTTNILTHNRSAVISLEQRKACKVHGVLTDFVCLTCSKESCSQCMCQTQDHQIISFRNFYSLVAQCMMKQSQMQSDLKSFVKQTGPSCVQESLLIKDQVRNFQRTLDAKVQTLTQHLYDAAAELKRDYSLSLEQTNRNLNQARKELDTKISQLTYWQDIYQQAHASANTKELLSVFNVIRRDQQDVQKHIDHFETLKLSQQSLAEKMTEQMDAEMSHIEMKLQRRLYDLKQSVSETQPQAPTAQIELKPDIITTTLQELQYQTQKTDELQTPRIMQQQNLMQDRQTYNQQNHSKMNTSMMRLEELFLQRKPSHESLKASASVTSLKKMKQSTSREAFTRKPSQEFLNKMPSQEYFTHVPPSQEFFYRPEIAETPRGQHLHQKENNLRRKVSQEFLGHQLFQTLDQSTISRASQSNYDTLQHSQRRKRCQQNNFKTINSLR